VNNRHWLVLVVVGFCLICFTHVTQAWEGEYTSRPYDDVDVSWDKFTSGSPKGNFDCVNDVSPDEDEEYVYARRSRIYDIYEMTNVPSGGGCSTPTDITIYYRVRHTGSMMNPNRVGIVFYIGSSSYWSTVIECPTEYTTYSFTPELTGEYSSDDWRNATIRINADYVARGTDVRCTQLYSVITYTISDPVLTNEYPSDGGMVFVNGSINTSVVCSFCHYEGSVENTVEFMTNMSGDWVTYGWYNYSGTSDSFTAYNNSLVVDGEGWYWWRVNFTEGDNFLSVVETFSFQYQLYVPPSNDRLPSFSYFSCGLFGIPFWFFWKRRRKEVEG